jgi:hypothetical protein
VIDKNGKTIASAVTNLDLHDIARVCRTYGVKTFYVITPLDDQKVLVNRILGHWTNGVGGKYNPKRQQALERVRVKTTFGEIVADITEREGHRPKTVATSARRHAGSLSYHPAAGHADRAGAVCTGFRYGVGAFRILLGRRGFHLGSTGRSG